MPAPSTPTNFVVQTGQATNFLSWDQMSGATSYVIQRSLDNVTFTTLATNSGTPLANYYLDETNNTTTVVAGTQYWYQVSAVNGSGASAYTASANIVPAPIGEVSLQWVRSMAQARADLVNSEFITLAEWNSYISNSYKELYNLIAQKFGDDYFVANPYSYTTSSTQLYPLPADFFKLLGVDVNLNPNDPNAWVTLRGFEFIQRNLFNYPNVYTFYGITNIRYRINGNNIMLVPMPTAGTTFRIWYVPRPAILMADTDILDGVAGWEEYVIVDTARKARQKQESDTQELMQEKAMLIQQIESAAENRNIGEPELISDSRIRNFSWGENDGYGNGGNQGW